MQPTHRGHFLEVPVAPRLRAAPGAVTGSSCILESEVIYRLPADGLSLRDKGTWRRLAGGAVSSAAWAPAWPGLCSSGSEWALMS